MGVINAGNFVNPAVSGETEVRLIDGLKVGVVEETVTPNGSATYDLTSPLPADAVVLVSQLKLDATVVATTAVSVGLGTSVNADKWLETTALIADTYGTANSSFETVLASDTTIVVQGTNGGGTAAGTLDSGGPITARIVYMVAEAV